MAEQLLQTSAFPRLDERQLDAIASCPHTRRARFHDGDRLFETGDPARCFFVVLSGRVDIIDETGDTPRVIVTHGPGQFTGDVSHLTGRRSMVTAVARGEVDTYAIAGDTLRHMLKAWPELADVILQAFIARRQLLRESGDFSGARVIGSRHSADTFRIREFLARNQVLFTWLDLESDPGVDELLRRFDVSAKDTPIVMWGSHLILRNPSNKELAEALGIKQPIANTLYDVAIVGGGPAGLAAAVYASSEGLSTVVLEREAPGGQASLSMRIENYLGFPTGLTGGELAERAVLQANRFGAHLPVPTPVMGLQIENGYPVLRIDGGESVTARSLIIATGADYRRLPAENCARYEGSGVYYAATPNEATMCRGRDVIVVGGGNSAGQAAVYLAGQARRVHVVVRGGDLHENMSQYLAQRLEETPNIEILLNTEVRRVDGDDDLRWVELVNNRTGEGRRIETPAVFTFIGATPRCEWLPPEIERDARGFIRTGPALARPEQRTGRDPFLLETSVKGVFAAGDARSDSVKRVASAVGEGAMAVAFVHQFLKER